MNRKEFFHLLRDLKSSQEFNDGVFSFLKDDTLLAVSIRKTRDGVWVYI